MTHKNLIHNLRNIVDYIEGKSNLHPSNVIEIVAKLGDEITILNDKLKLKNLQISELTKKGE